ncbi:MAG: DUF4105 domain-containing protein [Saprospiraceae bacterium]|nr:MAG: membrane protein [Bacteroidetes bacterium OLB9]MCO6462628.1 DUF4105 domain-containing protein [Saprospiraceae bacterium]
MKKWISIFLWWIFLLPCGSSQDALYPEVQISLLTCSPGDELYSIYGHNALRIRNSITQTDIVYNYGTFDFNTPGFALKFMRGKLPYLLSTATFEDFMLEYDYFHRSVREQILQLDSLEKISIIQYLNENMLPENRAYKYDFFMDNCATRLRDVLEKNIQNLTWDTTAASGKTFRQLIKEYQINKPWTNFGIDLIIGAPADNKTTLSQEMFLPDYLEHAVEKATLGREPATRLQMAKYELLSFDNPIGKINFLLTPYFLFSLLLLLEIVLFFRFSPLSKNKLIKIYDIIWMVVIFLGALLMLFMWFGTDHIPTTRNLNILWANLLIPFWYCTRHFIKSSKFILLFICICLVISIINSLPTFQILPQYFHPVVAIISITLLIKLWRIRISNPPQS